MTPDQRVLVVPASVRRRVRYGRAYFRNGYVLATLDRNSDVVWRALGEGASLEVLASRVEKALGLGPEPARTLVRSLADLFVQARLAAWEASA